MAIDAQKLWWPPARNLYNSLERLQADPASASADTLHSLVEEANSTLRSGLLLFQKQNAAAKKCVETEASLSLGSKRLPLDQALRDPAIRAAAHLVHHLVQTLLLI